MAAKRILLVEGNDDEHVIKHLCGTLGIQSLDEIKPYGGVEHVLASIPVRLKESDIEALGIIVDADVDLASRWEALRDRLLRAGFERIPAEPDPTGTIVLPPKGSLLPRVGIWIMPDNQTKGILEDFLLFLVPQESPLLKYVKTTVDGIPQTEQRFNESNKAKAIIHTWLAWQENPGKPLGTAITARYLDPSVDLVDVLVSWLKRLFFEQTPPGSV